TGAPRDVEVSAAINTSSVVNSQFQDDFGDAVSLEADTVIFSTTERLVPSLDADATRDFYVGRLGSTPVFVPGKGVAKQVANGFVFFQSSAPLAGNLDEDVDIFRMSLSTRVVEHVTRSRFDMS